MAYLALLGFVLLGVLTTVLGTWLTVRTRRFIARASNATGRYVDAVTTTMLTVAPSQLYPVIEYVTADGRTVRFERRQNTLAPRSLLGKEVPVLYDPHDPQQAVVNSFIELWAPPLITLTTGIGMALFAMVMAVLTAAGVVHPNSG